MKAALPKCFLKLTSLDYRMGCISAQSTIYSANAFQFFIYIILISGIVLFSLKRFEAFFDCLRFSFWCSLSKFEPLTGYYAFVLFSFLFFRESKLNLSDFLKNK